MRALSLVLVAGQVVGSMPGWALDATAARPAAAAVPSPPAVKVNRTVPQVRPAPQSPVFSAEPTEDELFRARVFGEPMVPAGGTSLDENRELAQALSVFLAGRSSEDFTPIVSFLEAHPSSPWRVALLTNLGLTYREAGYFTRALEVWKEAWELGQDETEPRVRALAERALAEYLQLSMLFGRHQVLEPLLDEVEGRDIGGSAGEMIIWARRGLWLLKNRHDMAIPSGPTALDRILALNDPGSVRHPKIAAFHPTFDGAGLDQMDALAREVGLKMRMAFREGDAEIPLPALVHLKAGHYSAVVREEGGSYLLHDPILGQEIWMTRKALSEESSGYFLIPVRSLPQGWRAVQNAEAAKVRGKCAPCHTPHPGAHKKCDEATVCGSCKGLAVASFHLLPVNLTLNDSPVGYSPPRGPSVQFEVTYNHRESFQPAVFTYSNLGPKWTFNWLSYVQDDPTSPSASARVYARGGGYDIYTGFSGGSYTPDLKTRAVLVRTSTSPIRYEHRLSDGTVEVFSQSDGSSTSPRRVFLTEVRDPQNQALTFTYDASLRVVAATDALGQVSTVSYEDSDPLKITKVTDPFGRFATFEYTGGKLTRITDVIGLASQFTYQAGDFINALTTPYGTTTFAHGLTGANTWAEMTDPLGGKERVEYGFSTALPDTEPPAVVPAGFSAQNVSMNAFLSWHWTKRAMQANPGDYSVARLTHWLLDQPSNYVFNIPHSRKDPLENRVWYAYPGQTTGGYTGTMGLPTKVARVLDDGQTQLRQYEYNSRGATTRETDALGRETVYEYDTNEIDLLRVKRKNGASYELLQSFTYNAQHKPLTVTDAAGQATTYTYNAQGQLLTVVTPQRGGLTLAQRTTTNVYDTSGRLESVTGPEAGATTTYGYDSYGRLRTVTDPEGYGVTTDYDALDRVTRVTFLDGTYEQTVYDRLDPARIRDRLGRWTHTFYNALRRPVSTRDPLGRTTTYQWCTCEGLDKLVDANGNATTWERDLQARVTREVRANGSAKELTYEATTSRLKKIKDAKNQEIHYSYFLDDQAQQVAYVNAQIATPNVSFAYDNLGRLSTVTDGTGTTTYGYHPIATPPSLGADLLASVDGPLANDTVTYAHDELGRVVGRTLNGITSTWSYDSLGRIQSHTSALGTIASTYVGTTDRLQSISYPNGQTTIYAYYPNTGDRRLQEIHHRKPGGTTLARFSHAYDAIGNITAWTQQSEAGSANVYDFGYDAADQLVSAVHRTTDPTPTILKRYGYAYDPGGNRTAEQIDDAVTAAGHDRVNRLLSQQPGGTLLFEGTTNEAATVTIQGQPASTTSGHAFTGPAQVPSGTSTVEVKGTDASGNLRTNTYQVSQAGASKSFSYDANGNLIADGTRAFEWDAANRLVAVEAGTQRTEFTYNGSGERTRILEKTGAAIDADRRFVPCGTLPCEERDPSGGVVKRFYEHGFQDSGGTAFYYAHDHLGSVRAVTDSVGTLRARYDYDPYGRRTRVTGDVDADLGFTGHFYHSRSGLHLASYRAYDADLGRWLEPDPSSNAELAEGPNLYLYVQNNPIAFRDLLGLAQVSFTVITVIRPPDAQAGVKTRHKISVDTDTGQWKEIENYLGPTFVVGLKLKGRGILVAMASGGKGCIEAHFVGSARSRFLPMRIDYALSLKYDANKGTGHISGRHDGYPSYEVWKDGVKIHDHPQGKLRQVWGSGDVTVNKDF